jgi:hypothetical protein
MYTRFKALSRPITHAYHLRNDCIIRNHPPDPTDSLSLRLVGDRLFSDPTPPFPLSARSNLTDANAPPTFRACCSPPFCLLTAHVEYTLQPIKPSNALHCGATRMGAVLVGEGAVAHCSRRPVNQRHNERHRRQPEYGEPVFYNGDAYAQSL